MAAAKANSDTQTDLRALFQLRPDVVFLNHGSFGACPKPVFETYQAWQLELERQPVEFLGRRFIDLMRTARQALGAFVGAAADDLVYIPNATTGLNVVARSLPLEPGDEVLTTDHEYSAPWIGPGASSAPKGAHVMLINPFACLSSLQRRPQRQFGPA